MKERTISMRVTDDWWRACQIAAKEMSKQMGVPISATTFVELSVVEYLTANGRDELAAMAKGQGE